MGLSGVVSFLKMDEYARKFEAANEFYLEGLEGDALGPAPFAPAEPVRQPDEAATVESLVARAEELKERFRVEVMLVLAECDATNVALGPNIKSAERSKEKVRLDYGGDARMLKDALRCSVICERIEQLCECYAKLRELEQEGFVQILLVRSSVREREPDQTPRLLALRSRALSLDRQVKNRFRSGAASGGYMDVNLCVLYGGLACEIQARARSVRHGAAVHSSIRSPPPRSSTSRPSLSSRTTRTRCSKCAARSGSRARFGRTSTGRAPRRLAPA